MILNIRVVPKAGRNRVEKANGGFRVYLTSLPQNGLANRQLIYLLSEYLHLKKYQIKIIKGLKSRDKVVEINA
jgi:uncharacterized protein (TIGR00251 family)